MTAIDSPLSATVTLDILPVDTNASRAAALAEKQRKTMQGTADLIVQVAFDTLEKRPAVGAGNAQRVTISEDVLRPYTKDQEHGEAARYGVYPYVSSDDALGILRATVKAALGTGFSSVELDRASGGSLVLDVKLGGEPSTALVVTSGASKIQTALTNQLNERRDTIAQRRAYFKDLARSPEMKTIFHMLKQHTGRRQIIKLASDAYVSPAGKVTTSQDNVLSDASLLKLDMDAIAERVKTIYADAAKGDLPESIFWGVPMLHWFSWVGR